MFVLMDRVSWSITVADPGEGPGGVAPPLVLDQTEALKAEKKIFPHHPPPRVTKGQDDRPPLSQGLDPALNKLVIEGLNCTKLPTGEIGG